jgi:nucleotide-binding universal stress UspA family protein
MRIAYGDPVDEIRREAEAGAYDVIVVGSHGRGGLAQVLLGSVSKALLEEAPCPVLVASKDATVRHEPVTLVR